MIRPLLRREPALYLMAVGFAALVALWVQSGVRELRGSIDRREFELMEFIRLRDQAVAIGTISPSNSNRGVAERVRAIDRRLAVQTWYRNLPDLQPRVVQTAAGTLVELVAVGSSCRADQRPDRAARGVTRGEGR